MKKIYLLLCFLTSCLAVQAQNQICYATGQLSSSLETTVKANASPMGNCSYSVRVYFHIVRRSNGTGGQSSSIINTILNNLSTAFSPQGISFQSLGYDQINNDSFFNMNQKDDQNYYNLIATNVASNAVNLYLLDDNGGFNGGRSSIGAGKALAIGGGYLPPDAPRQLVVPTLVAAHEMGHCLGLYHTFENMFCYELANGSNCSICGDFVCDTPAEYTGYANAENSNCAYTASYTDPNGNPEIPILSNLMNYARPSCLVRFTNGQGARMRSVIAMNSEIASAIAVTPVYLGGVYMYGTSTYAITNSTTGISVSNSGPTISITLPNYGTSTTFNWIVNNQSGRVSYGPSGRVATITLGGGASINVTCNISNSCGSTSLTFNCYNYTTGFAVYPNPANKEVNIAATKMSDSSNEVNTSFSQPILDSEVIDVSNDIKLVDKNNQTLWSGKLQKGRVNFSTAGFNSGIYYLQMTDGDKKLSKQLVIQH